MEKESTAATRRLNVISRHLQRCSFSVDKSLLGGEKYKPLYRYTLDDGNLPDDVRAFYEEDGYYVVKNLVPQDEIKRYTVRFEEICKGMHRLPNMTIMKDINYRTSDGEKAINKIQDFLADPVLSNYFHLPQVLDFVQNFVGPDIMAMHTMLINKPPDSGSKSSRHPLHQDLHYFPFRPADRIIASWTAMEKVTTENGCLVVVPGSHKGDLYKHGYPEWEGGVNKMYHGICNYDSSMPRLHLEMEAGDTVFFHPLLIHGSGTNRTKGFRKAISCHFASSFCDYIDYRGTTQETLFDEMMDVAHRRLGDDASITIRDIFHLRGTLVQGREGTL